MQVSFTKNALNSVPPKEKRYPIQDVKTPGLCLMVYPSGNKVFVLRRWIQGRQERIKIGNFGDITIEQARKMASMHNAVIGSGQNPATERKKQKQEWTFRELYDRYYLDYASTRTKDPEANKKMMELHVFPVIGSRKISEITKEHIRTLFSTIVGKRKPTTASRVIRVVKAVFNYGNRNEYFTIINPCIGLHPVKSVSRDRFLSNKELKMFFHAANQEDQLFRDFFLLLLYTGARKSNVLGMKWEDLRLDLKQWRIPDGITKNKDVNIVNLSDLALEVLKTRYEKNRGEASRSAYVFPGSGKHGHLKDPKKAFERVRRRMGVEDFRMHDLRRTLGSYMAISGSSLLTIGKALNHKSLTSTEIYARLSQAAILDAINIASKAMNSNR